jgi:hypothetical protein
MGVFASQLRARMTRVSVSAIVVLLVLAALITLAGDTGAALNEGRPHARSSRARTYPHITQAIHSGELP